MRLLTKWLLISFAILLAAYYVPGISVDSFYTALIAALLLGVLNIILKPILILLTLPITILTLGFFIFVINGFLFWFLGTFVKGFHVEGFIAALVGALIVSVVNWLGGKILDRD